MLKRNAKILSNAALLEFIDNNYLNNKRPVVPGGAWPKDLLRKKSIGDLQQIWFALLKEKNMLLTMKTHYMKHSEELGAMPAPSRLTMVKDSMSNLKAVMQERDFEATDKAVAIFKKRLAQGVYRYPPGPQPPPTHNVDTCVVLVKLDRMVSEDRLRELFGRYDVFEEHKGIVSIQSDLPEEVMAQKEQAEKDFEEWKWASSDSKQYDQWEYESFYDHSTVVLAPGEILEKPVVAHEVDVPEPKKAKKAPTDTLERLKWQERSPLEKTTIQLDSFPNVTKERPAAPGKRPIHPDEILGPWHITITYEKADGLDYAKSLGVEAIDGATVLSVEEKVVEEPFASRCPMFQEAIEEHEADKELQMTWPHVPEWSDHYAKMARSRLSDIAQHNYNNVFDYTDREALLTGKSVWEIPSEIDYSCGKSINVPAHAKAPTRYMKKPHEKMDTY